MDKGHGPEQENYDFLQENIKEEKMNVGKIVLKVIRLLALGLVLGVAMCVGFFAVKPWVEDIFPVNSEKVEISEEPEEEEEPEVVEKEETPVEIKHDIIDYRELQQALSEVIKEAEKKVVCISGIEQGESWNDGNIKELTGVVVGDNGRELLILSSYKGVKDLQLFRAEFVDGSTHEAMLKQKDGTNNLAVFSVSKGDMENETLERVTVASLANSNLAKQSELLFVLGSPFGYSGGVATGIVSSTGEISNRADNELKLLITDIVGNKKSSGVIFNTYGNVLGLVDTSLISDTDCFPLTAIGISQVKDEVELMSNGKNIPYIGIIGAIISKETSELENVPQGLFVQEVEVDSPAMAAGIQSGDIITEIDGETITSLNSYHKVMMEQEAGQTVRLKGQRSGLEKYVEIKFNVTVGVK